MRPRQEEEEVAATVCRRPVRAVGLMCLAARTKPGRRTRSGKGVFVMRRLLTGIVLAALLLLPVIGTGCGAKEEEEEPSARPRRTSEVRAIDAGSLAHAE